MGKADRNSLGNCGTGLRCRMGEYAIRSCPHHYEQATVILKDSSLQNQERLDKLEALLLPHVDAKEYGNGEG